MFKRGIILSIAAVCAMSIAGQASARTPSVLHVSGSYSVTDLGATSCEPHGSPSDLFCRITGFRSEYRGSLTGTTITQFEDLINCTAGRAHGAGTETFTGSIAGVGSGTLTWRIRFHTGFDCATQAVTDFAARSNVIAGTGDLAKLQGRFRFTIDGYRGELRR